MFASAMQVSWWVFFLLFFSDNGAFNQTCTAGRAIIHFFVKYISFKSRWEFNNVCRLL